MSARLVDKFAAQLATGGVPNGRNQEEIEIYIKKHYADLLSDIEKYREALVYQYADYNIEYKFGGADLYGYSLPVLVTLTAGSEAIEISFRLHKNHITTTRMWLSKSTSEENANKWADDRQEEFSKSLANAILHAVGTPLIS